ncbi:hypothetical protein Q9L58_001947 [Maublancomyces gigas]|uniref:Uncharacterized protein n=1 Tax=Discina gigas TaxID=1032678 RepID=A0ABR3GSZ7_9PEZI
MTKVFSSMKSSFDQITEQLQKVDTATHKPSMEDRCRLLKKEFEKPVAMWTEARHPTSEDVNC